MRASWFVVVGAVVSGLTGCGGEDAGDLFSSGGSAGASSGGSSAGGSSAGGSSAGGSSAGGSSAGGGAGTPSGGTAGIGSGGSATGGSPSGGSGGSPSGGSGGSPSGGSGGTTSGGSGGTTSGGSGGTTSGGSGGTTGGAGGTGGIATGGSGGGCNLKKWCKDTDGDGYGSPSNPVWACNKPGTGTWIQDGSKPEACGDCADLVKEAFPSSGYCGATGYSSNGVTSFDYNCDTYQNACTDYQKAGICGVDATTGTCTGSGYLPVPNSTAKNPYCGSSQYQVCEPIGVSLDGGAAIACAPSVKLWNHLTCK